MAELHRHILLGALAWKNDWIDSATLRAGVEAWVQNKTQSLAETLAGRGALTARKLYLLNELTEEYLARHGNACEGLSALRQAHLLYQILSPIDDAEVQEALTVMNTTLPPGEGAGWAAPRVGTTSAADQRYAKTSHHKDGGLGRIFRALDKELNREVALKEMKAEIAGNQALQARFLMEAEVTGRLEHPGIVPVYGMGEYPDGQPFYAMRFIENEDLDDAVKRFHANWNVVPAHVYRSREMQQFLRCFLAACQSIAYAHSRGVLHRDLKPKNVRLGPYGETLVMDWGLAKTGVRHDEHALAQPIIEPILRTGQEGTQAGEIFGTPGYMSPEQGAGQPEQVGPPTDIYGLGATLYFILAGRAPSRNAEKGAVAQQFSQDGFPSLTLVQPEVPPALAAICHKAMRFKPEDRYASVQALSIDMEHWLADEPVAAYPNEPMKERLLRLVRKRPGRVAGVLSASVMAVIALLVAVPLLSAAKNRETQARELAEQNETKAEERFRLARKVVDELVTDVSESKEMRETPGMQPLRRSLLKRARDYYQGFLGEKPTDAGVMRETAGTYGRLATIVRELEPGPQVLELLEKQRDLLEQLAESNPGDTPIAAEVGRVYSNIGVAQHDLGHTEAALLAYQQSRKLKEMLLHDRPTDKMLAFELGTLHVNVAGVLSDTGKLALTIETYRTAMKYIEPAAHEHPQNGEIADALATAYNNLANALSHNGKLKESLEFHTSALKIREALVRQNPSPPHYLSALADTHHNVSVLYNQLGRSSKAVQELEQAIVHWRRLVKENPAVPAFRERLAGSLNSLALSQAHMGQLSTASASARESMDIKERLHQDFPTLVKYELDAGIGRGTLAGIQFDNARVSDAQHAYAKAISHLEEMCRKYPDRLQTAQILASNYNNVAELLEASGKRKEALASQEKSRALRQQLVDRCPESVELATELADSHYNLGHLQVGMGRNAQALQSFNEALTIQERLYQREERSAVVAEKLAKTYARIGGVQRSLDRHADTFAAYERMVLILRELVKQDPDRRESAQMLGLAYNSLGNAHYAAEEFQASERSFKDALRIQEELAKDQPSYPGIMQDVARTHGNLGNTYKDSGKYKEAEAAYRTAIAIQNRLVEQELNNVGLAKERIGSHYNLGVFLARINKPKEALVELEMAAQQVEKLLKKDPGSIEFAHEYAEVLLESGKIHTALKNGPAASTCFDKATPILEELAAKHPDMPRFVAVLAQCYTNTGQLYAHVLGNPEKAVAFYGRAIKLLSEMKSDLKHSAHVSRDRMVAHWSRAVALRTLRRDAEALSDWDQARSLTFGAEQVQVSFLRARTLVKLGRHTEAIQEAERNAGLPKAPPGLLVDAASIFALSFRAVLEDGQMTQTVRDKLLTGYGGKAVELLARAKRASYFSNKAAIEQFQKDKDFDVLRDRSDFKKLWADIIRP